MSNTTGNGTVAMSDVKGYVAEHPVAEGAKGFPKGSDEAKAFEAWYAKKAGGFVRTNRGNEYRNTKDSDRLDQHARWHLRKAIESIAANAAKAAAEAAKPKTDDA
jgi:hypothetical protein